MAGVVRGIVKEEGRANEVVIGVSSGVEMAAAAAIMGAAAALGQRTKAMLQDNAENVKDYMPRPWRYEWDEQAATLVIIAADGGVLIVDDTRETDTTVGEHIVTAVNAHAALEARVAALEDALQGVVDEWESYGALNTPNAAALLAEARALLQNGGAS